MNKEDIIDYVAQTPHNSNRKVLGDMLDTLIEENSNSALIVPFTQVNGNVYSYPTEMYDEIIMALNEGRNVISSGLSNHPHEAVTYGDGEINFQHIIVINSTLYVSAISWSYNGSSPLNSFTINKG